MRLSRRGARLWKRKVEGRLTTQHADISKQNDCQQNRVFDFAVLLKKILI